MDRRPRLTARAKVSADTLKSARAWQMKRERGEKGEGEEV